MDFTALHRLLGLQPQPFTDEMLNAAVSGGLAETADLDWKSELPPLKDLPKSDFPKDIAAMANNGGGIIVYGVEESQKAATGRRDVGELTEQHERALRSAAVTAITPPIFGLSIHRIGQPGNQVVAIVIESSVDGPRLIYKGEYFGAPIRNDADTVWMKERQIELMYRTRFDERRHATEALTTLYAEQAVRQDTDTRAWLIAVAHPRLPRATGTRPTRNDAISMFREARNFAYGYSTSAGGHPLDSTEMFEPRPGLRRWIAPNPVHKGFTNWQGTGVSIHHNGAVTLTTAIGGRRTPTETLAVDHIDSAAIESSVANFMALIRAANLQLGTNEYDAQIGIEWTGGTPLIIQTVDQLNYPFLGHSLPLTRYTPVASTIRAGASDDDYHQQVRTLAEDCINQGGITDLRAILDYTPSSALRR
ncbi:transcriptional regulator [Rhodococcus sp. ACPA4]|uniref:ATP-binding protein n=1 Tax=Rhodococcus sp. ACPA4 TaxID=2028571 RepID=UPI000BB144AB|nr:ATP-binding protein [Rhodococcus sp. ACPA4]PBC36090.1 transcriptional regulator [Rhodococcus sp. ACPA4]